MARATQRVTPRAGALAYVLPFAVFIAFLALKTVFPIPQWARFAIEVAVILAVSRIPLSQQPSKPLFSAALGVFVFLIWVGPDWLIRGYRHLPLLDNAVIGHAIASTTPAQQHDLFFLTFRVLVSVVAVPILEELFWRGWLLRWLIRADFESIPLGTYSAISFWVVAALFASEHGPYWDVGLVAGAIYNWWMLRTGNLWDCIIAHSVTNGCLAWWVIAGGQWQYWL